MRMSLLAGLVLTVAACSQPAPETAAVANAAADNAAADNAAGASTNYVAAVVALSPEERRGVMFRAIRDAGLPCQEVTEETQDTAVRGNPVWRAKCSTGQYHLIQIAPDGNATVISRAGS